MEYYRADKKQRIAYFIGHLVVSVIMISWYFLNNFVPINGITEK